MMNAENRRRLKHAKIENDWAAIESAADNCLDYEPLDATLHLDLGNAFRHRGMRDHAIFAFECAYELLPQRSDIRETIEELMRT